MNEVIGYVTLFAGNFAPRNWAFCAGQLIPISQNSALFSILGTTYGGNGTTNFALPDLRGRTVIGAGEGEGLSAYSLGETAGAEKTFMSLAQMPSHMHSLNITITPGAAASGSTSDPTGAVFAAGTENMFDPSFDNSSSNYQAALTAKNVGNNVPVSALDPVLGLNYVICLSGIFPQRPQ